MKKYKSYKSCETCSYFRRDRKKKGSGFCPFPKTNAVSDDLPVKRVYKSTKACSHYDEYKE